MSASEIVLAYARYWSDAAALAAAKNGLLYNHFDCNVISGSESGGSLPVLQEYIKLFGEIWKELRRFESLIDQDLKDIKTKTNSFVSLDNKLGG